MGLYGYFRPSVSDFGDLIDKPDIDIWYQPTYENYFKVLRVMGEFEYDVTDFLTEQTPNPKSSYFKLEFDNFSLDLIPGIVANIDFFDAYKRKEVISVEGVEIFVMNYVDLITDKEATGRKKDLEDIKHLRSLKK